MNQVRGLVFYKNHFHDFFDKQSEKAKEKIDYVLFLVTHIDSVPEKFLKHIAGRKGLYEIRVEIGNNIYHQITNEIYIKQYLNHKDIQ